MSSNWLTRTCPNCGNAETETYPLCKSQIPAEELTFEEVKGSFVGLRKTQIFFSYFRCLVCHLLYAPIYFNSRQLREMYKEMPDNLMGEEKSIVSKTQSSYVRWASCHLNKVDKFLEIGPDIGLVSRELVNRFDVRKAAMIEPNVAVHEELRFALATVSDVSIVSNLDELPIGEVFDLVIGIHVYDHLLDPVSDLNRILEFSSKETRLIIVVHNEKSLLRRLMGRKWPPFCLQHPQLFNPQTLDKTLDNSGWALLKVSKSVNWWNLRHLARMGAGVLGIPLGWTRLVPEIQVPVRTGNLIALARIK